MYYALRNGSKWIKERFHQKVERQNTVLPNTISLFTSAYCIMLTFNLPDMEHPHLTIGASIKNTNDY